MLSGLAIDTIAKSGMNRHRPICAIWVVTRLKIVPSSTTVDKGRFFLYSYLLKVRKTYKLRELERHEHH
jgi:hypothetical protein